MIPPSTIPQRLTTLEIALSQDVHNEGIINFYLLWDRKKHMAFPYLLDRVISSAKEISRIKSRRFHGRNYGTFLEVFATEKGPMGSSY